VNRQKHSHLTRLDMASDIVGIAAYAIALMCLIADAYQAATFASIVGFATIVVSRLLRCTEKRKSPGATAAP
jgi:membrane protein implicated in regulation of membrane protease activity